MNVHIVLDPGLLPNSWRKKHTETPERGFSIGGTMTACMHVGDLPHSNRHTEFLVIYWY